MPPDARRCQITLLSPSFEGRCSSPIFSPFQGEMPKAEGALPAHRGPVPIRQTTQPMPKRPPTGFHARRAQQQRIDWDNPPQPTQPAAATPQSRPVGEVARHIKTQLKADPQLNDVWIEGEVRSFSRSGAGHYYFDLADSQQDSKSDAALSCAFFRRDNRGMAVQQGDQVLVHGSADIYLPRGSLQIIVDDLRPIGEGVLQAEFERLFRNLSNEGLFNPERKRPLPPYPRRIGVVTSPSGAVWHDIQQVISRRWPLTSLVLSPCLTQGAGAAESIAEGIQRLNLLTIDEPDLIIVARGGGSPEDLWAYNEEPVARAIFASEIPVISAVGHETDVSISDHVADRRAPTPVRRRRDRRPRPRRGSRTRRRPAPGRRPADRRPNRGTLPANPPQSRTTRTFRPSPADDASRTQSAQSRTRSGDRATTGTPESTADRHRLQAERPQPARNAGARLCHRFGRTGTGRYRRRQPESRPAHRNPLRRWRRIRPDDHRTHSRQGAATCLTHPNAPMRR